MKTILDITTTALGLLYILLEVRGSLWMWLVGGLMQALGLVLYYQSGLYADCGMEIYYLIMTIYGFLTWKYGFKWLKNKKKKKHKSTVITPDDDPDIWMEQNAEEGKNLKITRFPKKLIMPWTVITLALWGAIYYLLVTFTDSNVPVADSFTTALSLLGIWALAHKYLEQWFIWIAVDVVTSVLYFYKGIPFKASLYALYVIIAFVGFFKWRRQLPTFSQ